LLVCVFFLISSLPRSIAAAPTSTCRYTSETKTQSGVRYVCLFYKGKSTWIHVPKRSTSRLSPYEKTKLQAYNEIRKQISSSAPINIKLNFIVSSNFPKDLQSKYIDQINLASLAYDQFFNPNTTINVYFQTEKDEKFIDATPILARNKQDFANFLKEWKLNRNKQHVVGLAASFNDFTGKLEGHTGVIVSSRTSEKIVTLYSEQVVAHEYFHVVQDYFKYKKDQKGYPGGVDEYQTIYRPIFREGSANTVATALSMGSFETYLLFYRALVAENKGEGAWLPFKTLTNKKNVISTLKLMELTRNDPAINFTQFVLGSLAFEWLIAEYGFDAYKKLIYNQSLDLDFNENLRLTLGIDSIQFYSLAANHILEAFKFPLPR
jgi:hypothetical protein